MSLVSTMVHVSHYAVDEHFAGCPECASGKCVQRVIKEYDMWGVPYEVVVHGYDLSDDDEGRVWN